MKERFFVFGAATTAPTRTSRWPLPRMAVSVDEAAAALGVSRDFFDEHIAHELRLIRRGRRKLVSVLELERWLREAAHLTLESGDPGANYKE
jgi:excisionase family DNA binding protein